MSRSPRRDFLKTAAACGFAAVPVLSGVKASGNPLGANERVRVAVAGINGRGQAHIQALGSLKNVEIAWLVDPDSRLHGPRTKGVRERFGNTPRCAPDLRRPLDDTSLDVVSIAAPNHWHSLLAIWSCQAGKDVYVEKPCSHDVFEGRKLVEAARKYGRIVQHGTQSRSSADWAATTAAVRSGKYGRLRVAYGWASKPRPSIGFKEPKEPPRELDFDLWLGPAPLQPYHENIVHYNWHWFWDFGNGEIGNQGVHQMDIARWAMPADARPASVVSLGGRYGYKDQGQTPNTQLTVIDFGGPMIIFEDFGLVDGKTMKVANEFHTDEGGLRGGKFFPRGKTEGEPIPGVSDGYRDQTGKHFQNFIDCVRERKSDALAADILEGHLSALLCHLGNLSYRLGTEVSFRETEKPFEGDAAAGAAFDGMKRHLAAAAKLDLDAAVFRLGRKLAVDAASERFVNDDEANRLLACPYRPPYTVPQNV